MECDKTTSVNFGNRPPCTGCLKICKYEDKDGDGQKDYGESYLSGWEFKVTGPDGNSQLVTTGGSTGTCGSDYCATVCNLTPGEYTITQTLKDGWTCTTGIPRTVTVVCGKTTGVDFGNRRPCTGCLKICKYEDKDGDGQKDYGESYLSGWEFKVTGPDGNSQLVTTGGSTGTCGSDYCATVCNLTPGEYTITETLKDGWTCTTGNPRTVTVVCGKTTGVDFGNRRPCTGCLKICKYEDKDGDGQKDYGESYLSGWEFKVTGPDGNSQLVTTGGSTGTCGSDYCATVCNLTPGEYTITETLKDGWTCTTGNPRTVTVVCGKTTGVDFGNQRPCTGCLKICKYEDKDGDGQKDYGESYLSGWEFKVTGPDGNSQLVTTGGSTGTCGSDYCATVCNLTPGEYTITETPQAGWTCTTGNPRTVTVVCGKTTGVDFGNQRPCTGCLKICKYEDKDGDGQKDYGESYLSGWTFNVTGPDGNSQLVTTGGSTGNLWRSDYCVTVCELAPGEYTITETPQAGWTCTTGNPRTITVVCGKRQVWILVTSAHARAASRYINITTRMAMATMTPARPTTSHISQAGCFTVTDTQAISSVRHYQFLRLCNHLQPSHWRLYCYGDT